ncbi:MAG: tetratricopeptide repeat protein [Caulobacteraceae bacterium]|nr:tetratricopeptide repeat protein [Caulobacteraceae bacterium]
MQIVTQALEHHKAGLRDEAEALYRQALALDPHDPTALYLYGLFNFEGGRVEPAADLFKSVIAARPDQAEGYVALANLRHWQGAHGVAIEGYRQALALQPDHGGALVNLANALREQGDLGAAIVAARQAVERLPQSAAAHLTLAAALLELEGAEASVGAYQAAVELEPQSIEALSGLALALLQARRPREALEAADAALMLAPQSGDVWFVLGTALNDLYQPQEAVAALERSVKIDPLRAAAHLNLGNTYVELDQAEEAAASLQQALAIDPTLKEAHASLASVYLLAGEKEAAEHHCRLALELDPEMVGAHQNLASLLAAKGDAEGARRHRDQVYGRQNLFIEPGLNPERTVLVLTTSESGNVPHRHLLPGDRYTRLNWFIEYATPDQTASLPAYDAVFNAVGDADLAGPTLAPMKAFLDASGKRVINDPDRVALTPRQHLPDLLAGIPGVHAPRAARLSAGDLAATGLAAQVEAAGFETPVLIRPLGSHGGVGLVRAATFDALSEMRVAAGEDVYVTAYEDYQSADGWYRKYRVIFVDRHPFPYHLAISSDWLVHYQSSDMPGDAARVAEERRFLEDPASALGAPVWEAVRQIGQRMDLDYCGVDFSLTPDGRVLVFEANATMLVHPEPANGPLAHKNAHVEVICRAFQALIDR